MKNFLFIRNVEEMQNLSDGEKIKIQIVNLLLEEYDIFFLNEPIRKVSPLSGVIRNVLKEFKGTIISVSHDYKYIEEVIDTLYFLDKKGITKVYNSF